MQGMTKSENKWNSVKFLLFFRFGFFHDGINLKKKSEHHNKRGEGDSTEAKNDFFVENIGIRAFPTGHQSKSYNDDDQSDQHQFQILFPKRKPGRVCLYTILDHLTMN